MLGDKDVAVAIPASDVEESKRFYENTLGLKKVKDGPEEGAALYSSGNSQIYVYSSEFAGTNKATYAAWTVDDVNAMVENLKSEGVSFEQYDSLPGVTRDGDVYMAGDTKGAWFKDPSGNILAISSSDSL